MPQRSIEIDDRETVVVGGVVAALVLAIAYSASRIGFEDETSAILCALGLSLFFLAFPYWLWRLLRGKGTELLWPRSQPFLTLATVTASAVIPLVALPIAGAVGVAFSITGAILAFLVLGSWLRNGAFRSRLFFGIGAVVFAAWQTGVVWTSRYKMPLYWETMSSTANLHHDPVYLTAIGNMMNTYGIASTGLDGIPYTPYHYGSSWLFTRWSELLDTDLLSFYSLGYAIVMVPLFLAAFMMLAVEIRRAITPEQVASGWLRSNGWGWLAFAIGTIGIIPDRALYAMAVWNAHVVLSESYLASLPVFFILAALLVIAWRANAVETGGKGTLVFLLLILPAGVAALGFFKVSVMILLLALVMWAALRTGAWKKPAVAASIALLVVASVLTYKTVSLPAHNGGFYPLHFMRYSTPEDWHQFFPLVHFLWTWVYLAGRLFEERIADFGSLVRSLKSGRLLDAELLLILAILGFLPGEVLYIHGGSAIYFSDVQRWIALAMVVARAGVWVSLWRARRAVGRHSSHSSIRLASLLAIFVLAPFAVTMLANTVKPPLRMLRQNLSARTVLVSQAGAGDSLAAGEKGLLFDAETLERGLENSEYFAMVSSLRAIGRIPVDEKSDMALFIPQSYTLFWHIWDGDDRCSFAPLLAPSVTGMALIDGMPYYGCVVTDQYNMQVYEPRSREQTEADVAEEAVCGRAVEKGFRRVLYVEPSGSGVPVQRVLACS